MAVSAAAAAGVLSGIALFVFLAGWIGAAAILSAAGIFLAWFYKGRRPDLPQGNARRAGGGDAGKG